MKAFLISIRAQKGFTLIEIVVTILVASLLGLTFIQLMGTSMMGSAEPLLRVQNNLEIQGVMEKITAEYKQDTTPLDTLKTQIGEKDDVVEGGVYGSYTVIYNDYITFDESGNEVQGSGDSILKLTIADVNGEQRLTALFTE
ncbi:MAG: prepilin-type N-terminal cleavage/methylation domain-containing protein [Deltaproteobacteria bacterium]|nr:prepilin-type N-terminal cleavage/methylation domain-containing protein [Deltaproteobacteria bacterium]